MTDTPPKAAKRAHSDTRHGISRTDDYAWLRADNWQEVFKDTSVLDADIRQYLDAENAFQKAFMADTEALQTTLFSEMKGRIKEDDESVPAPDGPWAYGTSFATGGQQPRYYRVERDNLDGERHIMLDGDKEAEGKEYFKLGGFDRAPGHGRMLWAYDDKGSEYYTVRVRDLSTGEDLDDVIKDMGGGAVFTADSTGIVYTLMDDNHRPSKVFYHKVGSDQSDDVLLYEEPDSGFFVGVGRSRLDDFIEINSHDHQTSEVRLLDATDPTKPARMIEPRLVEREYTVSEGGNELFILTNADGAKDFKIVSAPFDAPQKVNWKEVVAHEPGRLIINHDAYARHLVWLERRNALPRIVIKDRETGAEHAIAFDEEAYSLGLRGSAEYDTDVIRFTYSSMTTPSQTF
ncbi:MAG: S9 family peptidase, partial [Pseudomonadota bacterium]